MSLEIELSSAKFNYLDKEKKTNQNNFAFSKIKSFPA